MASEHYSNSLLCFLGEGNFSFSASLALSPTFIQLHSSLIATDYVPDIIPELESVQEEKMNKTNHNLTLIKENVSALKSRNHKVLLNVDASKLHENPELLHQLKGTSKIFLIFNFPHAKSKKMKIDLNRDLLRDFFISSDKLYHILEKSQPDLYLIPIVSLCAGQSGIPEVDSVSRGWGNSWQINDMAAHGSFVCTSISKFDDWELFKLIKSSENFKYQSSYYRLQSGSGFTTTDSLTFFYEHRSHIDPNQTRLASMLRFTAENNEEILSAFQQAFGPLSQEKVVSVLNDKLLTYHHVVTSNSSGILQRIISYLSGSKVEVYENKEGKLCVMKGMSEEKVANDVIQIGKVCGENTILYVNEILQVKYKSNYRTIISNAFSESNSLYPHIHEFHISFWASEKFTMDLFMEVLLDVYGLMLKSVEIVEEYVDKEGKRSICWRIQVESLDSPLSRVTAHEIYLRLRQELNERLEVIVR